ncbi:MAG: Glycogen accumulation regulator GarA [Lentisphaerae bacterium ADurb.Bin242]|nr:MAG: Glycogen accumulation regulator GarA [Lentisphaerae bacterium ADurb.Bin242]
MNLYFLNGNRKGEQWELVPPGICIGREMDNDIQLLMPGVSRYHAKIEFTPSGEWRIIDLGSTNGTKVNSRKIDAPQVLKRGSEIMIGEQLIRFGDGNRSSTLKVPQSSLAPGGKSSSSVETKTVRVQLQDIFGPPPPSKQSTDRIQVTDSTPKIDGNIFGKKAPAKEKSAGKEANPAKRRLGNLLFLLLVVCLAAMAVITFVIINASKERPAPNGTMPKQERNPFLLVYEKQIISKNNVFRFYIKVENNSALFKLDDLKHQRHFSKGIGRIEPEILKSLENTVKETDFMKISSDAPGRPVEGADESRTLLIGYDSKLNSVTVRNAYPKSSFETIEHALNRFADDYGLKTISLSEEEMRDEADRSFNKAEELLANYQARPENLRNAILRYQITIDFLDQFDPKPKNWSTAKRKLAEAEGLLQKTIKDAEFNLNVLYKRKQYAEAIEECNKLMLILDPEQNAYQKIRDLKITLEKRLSVEKKKGRR